MVGQTGAQVNPIQVTEMRLSVIRFMPALGLLHSLDTTKMPCTFLSGDVDFQNQYEVALENESLGASNSSTTVRTPWWCGYGRLFWIRTVPDRNPYAMGRAIVPFDYNLTPYVKSLTLTDGTADVTAYLFPWGIGILVDAKLVGAWALKDAVNLLVDFHNSPRIQWTFDNANGKASPAGMAAAVCTRMWPLIYGDAISQEPAGDEFSIATVIEAAGVKATDPIAENGPIHYALEGMVGWKRKWYEIPPKANSLVSSRISSASAPVGDIVYGKTRSRAIWFPGEFRPAVGYPDTLPCYHQNLSIASLYTEALCVLAQDAASQLRSQGSLSAYSAGYRTYAQLAAGILGRMHGKRTDDSDPDAEKKVRVYRSGSIRSQILTSKDDVNLLRLGIPSINKPLDT